MKKNTQKNTEIEQVTTILKRKMNPIDFPVVGIGASAGGLEALQEFFKRLPPNPGASFVVIQHLSPDYKSLMNELLARYTEMHIQVVEDGIDIKENQVYLLPPRMNMTILHGKLLLREQSYNRTLNLPIDIFLRSLAKDQERNAIGIILSGTGCDGTLGIRAIKEYGGIAMVQDNYSAKFDGMPRSSVATGMVDFILPPDKLAEELVNYIKHPFINKSGRIEYLIGQDENQLLKIISVLRDHKGVDFTEYKENTIFRRLEKRISINRFEKVEDYVRYMSSNNREASILFDELLIGVTRFFRDEDSFKMIRSEVLPALFKEHNEKREMRVWVAGCSTGEEAYSLAILFREYMLEQGIHKEVKIFATDIDSHSLEYAGAGFYPESIVSDVTPERISKYFVRKEGGYQINENIRSMIIFAKHNLLQDPPFSKLDLISCRNLLIYLNTAAQQKILSMFYLSLVDTGYMFLGSSESLGNLSEGFITVNNKAKIYKYSKGFRPPNTSGYGISSIHKSRSDLKSIGTFLNKSKPRVTGLDGIFDEILADFVPPSVIVDDNYEVIHTVHQVNKYLSIPTGQISLNLLKMLSKDLGLVVSSLLRRASKKSTEVIFENVQSDNSGEKRLSIAARKIVDKKTKESFYLISFIERERDEKSYQTREVETVDVSTEYQERLDELERQLQLKSESLQATVEELETSNEELQSSNEELIASNEELQSTNEELQSVNEELYTVNSEHIKKIDELIELNSDMDNLLRNTHIGTLFLDKNLTIRKTNNIASDLTNILLTDVGRPIHHLSFEELYRGFVDDIYRVMENFDTIEKEILDKSGKYYLMRIVPYRTAENTIDGIIITFVNISSLKETEIRSYQKASRLNQLLEMSSISWWEWHIDNDEMISGQGKYAMLGYQEDEIAPGYQGYLNLLHPDDVGRVFQTMKDCLLGKLSSFDIQYRIKAKNDTYLIYRDKGAVVEKGRNRKPKIIGGVIINVSEQNSPKKSLKVAPHIEPIPSLKSKHIGIITHDINGRVVKMNTLAKRMLGLNEAQLNNESPLDFGWQVKCVGDRKFDILRLPGAIFSNTGKKPKEKLISVFNPKMGKEAKLNLKVMSIQNKNNPQKVDVYTILEEV